MRILFLSPQPFFQERGTPIAVRMALEVLRKRKDIQLDLLVYHEGQNLDLENVTIHRIWMPSWLQGVGAGLSWKKLLCDVSFTCKALWIYCKARFEKKPYDVIHAVEESAFIALLPKLLGGTPYLYDMDSSLSLQIVEKVPLLKSCRKLFELLEEMVIRNSLAVVPVCDALAVIALNAGAKEARILHDFSLLTTEDPALEKTVLRNEAGLAGDARVALYVGNLEHYQGIDLLLNSWKLIFEKLPDWNIVLIGGSEAHRQKYDARLRQEKIGRVILLGARSTTLLGTYLKQADILLSPRIEGNNTPMKLYSYLHAGVATVATNLFTHTQILTPKVAHLAEPNPQDFSAAIAVLANDNGLRSQIGNAARLLAQEKYTFERFQQTLNLIYDGVEAKLKVF